MTFYILRLLLSICMFLTCHIPVFIINPHSIVARMSRISLLEAGANLNLSDCNCNWTRTHNHLVHKRTLNHLAKLAWVLSVRLNELIGCGCESSSSHLLLSSYISLHIDKATHCFKSTVKPVTEMIFSSLHVISNH